MKLGIITLFPEMFYTVIRYGAVGRALNNRSLLIDIWNPRNFSHDRNRSVDDRPYGGGPGMLMTIQPLRDAIHQAKHVLGNNDTKVIYLSPQGKKINQKLIRRLVLYHYKLIFVCGRYQGIDERLIRTEINEEWSIGDYIISGGELAVMVLLDAMARLLPGVLSNPESIESDSFVSGRLDCPHYTRPKEFEGMQVPEILLSGHHHKIARWKLKQSLGQTWIKRPDLLQNQQLTFEEKNLLFEFKNEYF